MALLDRFRIFRNVLQESETLSSEYSEKLRASRIRLSTDGSGILPRLIRLLPPQKQQPMRQFSEKLNRIGEKSEQITAEMKGRWRSSEEQLLRLMRDIENRSASQIQELSGHPFGMQIRNDCKYHIQRLQGLVGFYRTRIGMVDAAEGVFANVLKTIDDTQAAGGQMSDHFMAEVDDIMTCLITTFDAEFDQLLAD